MVAENSPTTSGADDQDVEGAFYLPTPGDFAFTDVRELADQASEPILEIAKAFLNNLEAVL